MRQILYVANLISLTRIACMPVVVALFLRGHIGAALITFTFGALTDYLDGYCARRFGHVTWYGSFLDPLADKVLVFGVLGVFVYRGLVPFLRYFQLLCGMF